MKVDEDSADRRRELGSRVAYDIRRLFSNRPLLKTWNESWVDIKRNVDITLQAASLSINRFAEMFPKIELTADPRIFAQFAASRDRLCLNIWATIYHPPFELAATLIHESDHRAFHVERGTLLATEAELREFALKHNREMELRAYRNELDFLNKLHGNVDPVWEIEILPGRLLLKYELDTHIASRQKMFDNISTMEAGADLYKYERQNASYTDQIAIMEKLGIRLDPTKLGRTYRRTEVSF
jgi:hypothetical protein